MIKTYDLNDLVVLSTLVSGKVVLEAVSVGGNIATLGGLQVVGHVRIVGEEGSGGTHVANGSHTSARERLDTRAEVFDNGAGSTLDGEDSSNLRMTSVRNFRD